MTTTPSAPPGTLQHGVSRREFPRHPVKQEKLHRAVAPTQGVGPGVAAEIDQGVEEEPDMDVLSELAPRFGCKELSNKILLFGFGERAAPPNSTAIGARRALRSAMASV